MIEYHSTLHAEDSFTQYKKQSSEITVPIITILPSSDKDGITASVIHFLFFIRASGVKAFSSDSKSSTIIRFGLVSPSMNPRTRCPVPTATILVPLASTMSVLVQRFAVLKLISPNSSLYCVELFKWYLIRLRKLIDCACDSDIITINKSSSLRLNAAFHNGKISDVVVDFAVPRGAAIATLRSSGLARVWYTSLWKGGISLFSAVGKQVRPKRAIFLYSFS